MKIIETVEQLQQELASRKKIGFVPTMGALHGGHISLVKQAITQCDTVVVSVFVNPTQFNDPKDLERYPRNIDADAKLLGDAGADFLFAPSVREIYPQAADEKFKLSDPRLTALTGVMEGARRVGHFDGVVQVVGRLFDIVKPEKAYFGEKDFQQLAIIRAMVATQGRDIQIVGCPIVRAESGLALSSRNALLSDHQRVAAAAIYKSLSALRASIEAGGDTKNLIAKATLDINKNEYLCVEYISVVHSSTLTDWGGGSAEGGKGSDVAKGAESGERGRDGIGAEFRICAAVQCGAVRLIDNV